MFTTTIHNDYENNVNKRYTIDIYIYHIYSNSISVKFCSLNSSMIIVNRSHITMVK